jgi:predicted nucleic acid-binding protein
MTFLETVLPGLHIVHLGETERSRTIAWFGKLSRDHRISFCDAVSYVVVTERLDYMPCLAFDDDFERLGLTVIEDLEG